LLRSITPGIQSPLSYVATSIRYIRAQDRLRVSWHNLTPRSRILHTRTGLRALRRGYWPR
jgi:hypothetical protein